MERLEWLFSRPQIFLIVALLLASFSIGLGVFSAHAIHVAKERKMFTHISLTSISTTAALGPAGYIIGYVADEVGLGKHLHISPSGVRIQNDEPGTRHSLTVNVLRAFYGKSQ